MNWLAPAFDVFTTPHDVGAFTAAQIEAGVWTLCLPAGAVPPPPACPPVLPHSCVGVVKHALGLRAPLVLTPRQLHRALRRRGAVPVLPARPEVQHHG